MRKFTAEEKLRAVMRRVKGHDTSNIFHQKLKNQKMVQSMSRVVKCIDNGPMEKHAEYILAA